MFYFIRVHYAPKKSLVHTSKVDLPLSHTLQPPITHLMQSLVYCFGAQCAPLEHSFATVLSSRSQRVWWFHIVVVNDVSGMAGRALLKICIFQLAASFPVIGLLHVVPLLTCWQIYSHAHPAIGFWSLCCSVCFGRLMLRAASRMRRIGVFTQGKQHGKQFIHNHSQFCLVDGR